MKKILATIALVFMTGTAMAEPFTIENRGSWNNEFEAIVGIYTAAAYCGHVFDKKLVEQAGFVAGYSMSRDGMAQDDVQQSIALIPETAKALWEQTPDERKRRVFCDAMGKLAIQKQVRN